MSVDWIARAVTTLALCWRLDRRDGVSLGFTAHDRDLLIGGLLYRASPGMTPSAISQTGGFDVDTLDVAGALTGDAITEADLAAGRWDGARVRLFAVDWSDAAADALPLARGALGAVSREDGAFRAELRGPTSVLEAAVVETTSPDCRATLGDPRCRVDLAGRTRIARLAGAGEGVELALDQGEPVANAYGQGRLEWIEGANSGLASPILRSDGALVVLAEAPRFVAPAGTRVRLTEGCDRLLATCRDRFANAINFRGEPWLPGNDLLTRYPGA